MKWKLLLLSLPLMLMLGGCNKKVETQPATTFKVNIAGNEVKTLIPDSIFSCVEYIKLESGEKSQIQKIDKIITGKHVYILDRTQNKIFIFDYEGNFINKISKQGNGSDDYLSISDFTVKDNRLYLLSPSNHKIMIYDLVDSCKHTEDIKLDDSYHQLKWINNYLYLFSNFTSNNLYNITIVNLNGKMEKQHSFPVELKGKGTSNYIFSKSNNSVFCTFPYDFSIYKLNRYNLTKVADFDFGDKMMPHHLLKAPEEKQRKYLAGLKDNERPIQEIDKLIVTKSHYICTVNHGSGSHLIFQNRSSSDYIAGCMRECENFPLVKPEVKFYNDSCLIQIIEPEVIAKTKDNELGKSIPENLLSGDSNDNPVLAFYTLKDKYR